MPLLNSNNCSSVSSHLGVEIHGIDLTELDDFGPLLNELARSHLLIVRNQNLSEEQLVQISCKFGEPIPSLMPKFRLENYPVISRYSNAKGQNNEAAGAMAPEYVFHSDSYLLSNPNKETLLYSLKAPEFGGETFFVNMCTAYDLLEEDLKELLDGKKIFYKNAYLNQPPVAHPIIRTNPITQRKSLFVNLNRALGIEGLDEKSGLDLIKFLYDHSVKPERIYKHKWHNGDLLIWDNPTTMH